MVPVMRRKLAMLAVLGGLAAGLGCQHIGGKHDCGYNPNDYAIGAPTAPRQTFPVTGNPAPVVDPMPMPKGKTDADPKDKGKDMKDTKDSKDKGKIGEE
jgi:hypothetical protein